MLGFMAAEQQPAWAQDMALDMLKASSQGSTTARTVRDPEYTGPILPEESKERDHDSGNHHSLSRTAHSCLSPTACTCTDAGPGVAREAIGAAFPSCCANIKQQECFGDGR